MAIDLVGMKPTSSVPTLVHRRAVLAWPQVGIPRDLHISAAPMVDLRWRRSGPISSFGGGGSLGNAFTLTNAVTLQNAVTLERTYTHISFLVEHCRYARMFAVIVVSKQLVITLYPRWA